MKRVLLMLITVFSLTMLIGCGGREVTITYVENGGTDLTDLVIEQGSTINETSIEREGYTFTGWYEDEALTTTFDFDTEIVRNISLYAGWSINSYTVTFDFNNGTDDHTYTGDFNSNLEYPENPTKEGHAFDAWYLDEELETEFDATKIPSSDLTVYAGYTKNEYTVNFYYESGQDPVYTEIVKYGEGVESVPALPVITGYATEWDRDVTVITGDLDVYVVSNILEYKITFKDYEGTTYEILSVEYGSTITPTSNPSRTGYDFIGYYSQSLETNIDLSTYTVSEDLVLQDVFQIQTFSVLFLGGEDGSALGDVQIIDYGSAATAPTEGLEKVGYSFTGWDVAFDNVTQDLTVTAQYSINQYTANFNANGGVYTDSTEVLAVTQDYNSSVTVSEVPTKAGFIFQGWFTDLTYSEEVYFGTEGVSMSVNGFTVYAKWVELVGTTYTVSGTYYYEQVGISTDELSLDGVYTQTSSEVYTPFVNIYYNTDISAVRNIEGYEFYKYVIDGVDYFDEDVLVNVTEDMTVDVYYRKIILNVNFSEVISGSIQTTTYYTYYNGTLVNVPTVTPVAGMTVIWDNQNFENIKENLSVTAFQYDDSYQTVIFMSNGTIMYIATNDGAAHSIIIASTSPLWNLELEGYVFLGWYIEGTDTLVALGDLYYDDAYFTQNITNLEARWLELVVLEEPTNIDMDVDSSNNTITIDFTVNPSNIDSSNVYPTDFVFILNGTYIQSSDIDNDTLMNYITQNGDVFTLTLESTDSYYDLFKEVLFTPEDNYLSLVVGTHILQIVSVGDYSATTDSNPSTLFQFYVESIYDGIPEDVTTSDYYLIEDFGNGDLRYIFYSNLTYQFSGKEFEIVQGSNVMTADGNTLTTTGLTGEFIFTITDSENGTRTYHGLVVEDIRQFDIGSSYHSYLTEVNQDLEDDIFLDQSTNFNYLVGSSNGFYLDLLITDNNGSKIALENVLLDYSFYLNGSATALTEAELVDYVEVNDNVMYFTNLAVGNEFKVMVEPTYEATLMDVDALEFNITINNGHNAFTNDDLKTLYADMDVDLINIHRNIEASLYDNQTHEDGTPINEFAYTGSNFEDMGNVYYRVNGNTDDDGIVLEGNFMTIDGSDIPTIEDAGFGLIDYATGYEIISTQIGIFYYNVKNTQPVNNNTFTMNNLRIIGNTTTPSVNYAGTEEEILYEESLMSKNSGGMLGVVVRAGEASLNNLVIGYTVIGVTTNAWGENTNGDVIITQLDYVQIYDSWANSVFLHGGSGVSLDNSDIGTSGGAAIHFEDIRPASGGYSDPQLFLSETTEINNWISGSEAWFKAYGMGPVALTLKSGIDNGIDALGKTIIKVHEDEVSGLQTEMMNFVFLSLPNGSAHTNDPVNTSETLTASQVALDITDEVGNTLLARSWDFISFDPRTNTSTNQFAFAVGSLSDTAAFIQMITDIKTIYYGMTSTLMSDEDAGNVASIAGFYNLNANDALSVAGAMEQYGFTVHEAVIAVKGTLDYPQPQYIEVISALPLTDAGNATILIEMFNEEAVE